MRPAGIPPKTHQAGDNMTTNPIHPQHLLGVNPRPPSSPLVFRPSGMLSQHHFNGVDRAHQYGPVASEAPKSAGAARLWQFFFGWSGVGHFYTDSIGIALTQIALGVFGLGLLVLS